MQNETNYQSKAFEFFNHDFHVCLFLILLFIIVAFIMLGVDFKFSLGVRTSIGKLWL